MQPEMNRMYWLEAAAVLPTGGVCAEGETNGYHQADFIFSWKFFLMMEELMFI